MVRLTFDQSAKDFVLDSFGKAIDGQGYIVEKNHPDKRILTKDGLEIKKERFGGIAKGSEIYYSSDVSSLLDLYDKLEEDSREK